MSNRPSENARIESCACSCCKSHRCSAQVQGTVNDGTGDCTVERCVFQFPNACPKVGRPGKTIAKSPGQTVYYDSVSWRGNWKSNLTVLALALVPVLALYAFVLFLTRKSTSDWRVWAYRTWVGLCVANVAIAVGLFVAYQLSKKEPGDEKNGK